MMGKNDVQHVERLALVSIAKLSHEALSPAREFTITITLRTTSRKIVCRGVILENHYLTLSSRLVSKISWWPTLQFC